MSWQLPTALGSSLRDIQGSVIQSARGQARVSAGRRRLRANLKSRLEPSRTPPMNNSHSRPVLLKRILAGVAALLVVLVLVIVFFPWDVLRGPINRYVSD